MLKIIQRNLFLISMTLFILGLFITQEPKNEYAKILNSSGKQRMLSQKLFVLSSEYFHNKDPKIKEELIASIKEIESVHAYLRTKIFTEQLRKIYLEENLDKNLSNYLSNYYKLLETNEQKHLIEARKNSKKILIQLDNAVNEYERYIDSEIKNVDLYKDIMIAGFLITIAVLLSLFLEIRKQLKVNNKLSSKMQKMMDTLSKYVIYSKTDLKGRITEVSEAFCKISEYKKEELLNKPHNLIRHPSMSPEVFEGLWETIQKDEIWQGEVENKTKSGSSYWVDVIISPEYDDNGNKTGYVAVRHDITANKKIAFQTIQLMNSEKMASLGEMIGNIAHQWRQPLSVITTASSGIRVKKEYNMLEDEFLINSLKEIENNSQYLSRTIDTFRNFVIDKKELETINLIDTINSAIDMVEASLTNNHIKLQKNTNNIDFIKYRLIVAEFIHVIINIINNAKDAVLEKNIQKPQIIINLDKNSEGILITLADNAGGIPDNVINKIFDPYFTTKHKAQGTGLGLHMSYRIIENLEGKLSVENIDGGAKFTIELPYQN